MGCLKPVELHGYSFSVHGRVKARRVQAAACSSSVRCMMPSHTRVARSPLGNSKLECVQCPLQQVFSSGPACQATSLPGNQFPMHAVCQATSLPGMQSARQTTSQATCVPGNLSARQPLCQAQSLPGKHFHRHGVPGTKSARPPACQAAMSGQSTWGLQHYNANAKKLSASSAATVPCAAPQRLRAPLLAGRLTAATPLSCRFKSKCQTSSRLQGSGTRGPARGHLAPPQNQPAGR